ncbi:MAG TPA: bifunctional 2-C-methyl-D-erythritol 4-phosphate cytidylyltransferase/2-C-methyl-D-erythritol 2,4-cyclodiphosphate synthase [Allosphingosinicella sp.]
MSENHTPPRVVALIVAGGRGARAGEGVPKQYRSLGGMPVLRRTVLAFMRHPRISDVRVVIHPDDRALYEEAVEGLGLEPSVTGGDTRQASVAKGLAALGGGEAKVLIHDAARALVPGLVIDRCLDALREGAEAVVPAIPVVDSLRRGSTALTEEVDRAGLLRVQTPQCFDLKMIRELHESLAGNEFTDDAALAMQGGIEVATVEGDETNLKLTTPEDFERAAALLGARRSTRTGFGFDVHAFEEGDHVWIGGIQIPHGRALKGHSDADVALHALTDALLGAIAAGDIGDHFPPSDPQWRGAPSSVFLEHARTLVERSGGRTEHVDVTIICEAPKIGPHREAIRARIAELLRLDIGRVSVKATTTERLGFTGRGEGIAAQAAATVTMNEIL